MPQKTIDRTYENLRQRTKSLHTNKQKEALSYVNSMEQAEEMGCIGDFIGNMIALEEVLNSAFHQSLPIYLVDKRLLQEMRQKAAIINGPDRRRLYALIRIIQAANESNGSISKNILDECHNILERHKEDK